MRYNDKLREGLSIKLEVNEGEYPGIYTTKIEELNQEFITIGVPIHDGQFVPLRKGTSIKIYFHDNVSNYFFITQIISRMTRPIPIFTIGYPDQIVKEQRRKFIRVQIVKELQYQIIGKEGLSETHKGYMLDLSGGGILLKSKIKIYQNSMLLLTFNLDKEKIKVPAKVICYFEEDKNNFRIPVEFCDISERLRDKIIAYVFKMQRELLRKGLN